MPERSRYPFPVHERLKSKKQIERLFKQGISGFVYPLRYVVMREEVFPVDVNSQNSKSQNLSVMISVPKRYHKSAVARNRLKRRMREAYRLNCEPLREMTHTVCLSLSLMYVSDKVAEYPTLENALRKIIQQLAKKY